MPLEQFKMLGYDDNSSEPLCMIGNATLETLSALGSEFKIGDWFISVEGKNQHVTVYGPYTKMNDTMQEAHDRFGVTSFREPFSELIYT